MSFLMLALTIVVTCCRKPAVCPATQTSACFAIRLGAVGQQCSVTEVKQCLHLKLSASSVSYLYTHLNYVESGLGRFVMGNLI